MTTVLRGAERTAMGRWARELAAPGVRRARRELQWRRVGPDLRLDRAAGDGFPYEAAVHSTPIFRQLPGVDRRLQENKAVNLRLAASSFDGVVLAPGQRFSFWWHVGRPTYRRGFRDGLVLSHGQLREGVGGGLCQLTNLIYWMTLHTPLTVVERWRHSYDVFPDNRRTQPFGSGATCAWPVLDLQIENRTSTTYRLGITVGAERLAGAWTADRPSTTGYQIYESQHLITNDAPGVFTRHNVVRRRVLDLAGHTRDDELVAVNQARLMYQPFLEAGTSRSSVS
jgi:vancomycin resistance protein VanW